MRKWICIIFSRPNSPSRRLVMTSWMTTVTPSFRFCNPNMRDSVSNQRGQVAVLFALIFPLFVLLLAFFVNMGLLINQKIRLQNAVDAGVYSATASMARDLNRVASLNREIRNVGDGDANHPTW